MVSPRRFFLYRHQRGALKVDLRPLRYCFLPHLGSVFCGAVGNRLQTLMRRRWLHGACVPPLPPAPTPSPTLDSAMWEFVLWKREKLSATQDLVLINL